MKIKSPAFENGDSIPDRFSRDGGNRTPPLEFDGIPAGTKSLALIMDDPDAPRGLFTHWVVFNLDPGCRGFAEGHVPDGMRFGRNSWNDADYGGPRPPDREHRYFFKLFAVDQRLPLANGAARADVERAMEGHILMRAELMGRFAPRSVPGAVH